MWLTLALRRPDLDTAEKERPRQMLTLGPDSAPARQVYFSQPGRQFCERGV